VADFDVWHNARAVLDNGTVLEIDNLHTVTGVTHISRGLANMEEEGFAGMSGFPPAEAHVYLALAMVAGAGFLTWENGNADSLEVALAPGQTFELASGKSFDVSATAATGTVFDTGIDVAMDAGRGVKFQYITLSKTICACCDNPDGLVVPVTSDTAARFTGQGTGGFLAFHSPSGLLQVYTNSQLSSMNVMLNEVGNWCIYPSDINGVASGEFNQVSIADIGISPIDFSPLNNMGPLSYVSPSFGIDSVVWTSISLPTLSGSNFSLEITSSPITSVTVPSGQLYKRMTLTCPLDQSSVDDLCNALDPTATGLTSTFTGTAAATAASAANRAAYIGNGNTIVFVP
jgi:hypothetical protein